MALTVGDVKIPASSASASTSLSRRLLLISVATLAFAALTALVFVMRAGDPGGNNWPTEWDLKNSDNGVLLQFASDVFAGRRLDWGFSPQVYVFPEIPISLLAYALAGGSAQVYYLIVAMLNNALLFLALLTIVSLLWPRDGVGRQLLRTALAASPLLLLPLIASSEMYSYHLAPTYYYGMYVVIVIAPALFLARGRWVRIAVAAAIALTGASNPLAFVFTAPALACVAVIRARAEGWRVLWRPAAWVAAIVLVAGTVRLSLFSGLQGTSPLSYIGMQLFLDRFGAVRSFIRHLIVNRASVVWTVLAVAIVVVDTVRVVKTQTRGRAAMHRDSATLTRLYYAAVPVTGLLGTVVLLITHRLYFWPVLVAPLVFVLLAVPDRWLGRAFGGAAVAFVGVAVVTGGVGYLGSAGTYFTYRSAETQCLDDGLPAGVTLGYSTFSDARRLSLTSTRPFRLIQLTSSGGQAGWLTNRAYARDGAGTFFYVNTYQPGEPPISTDFLTGAFGTPDRQFSCGRGKTVWVYEDPIKKQAIAAKLQGSAP